MRLFAVAVVVLCGCPIQIQSGLDETSANEVEAVLARHGVAAKKAREGGRDAKFAVAVPSDQATAAIQILRDNELPRVRAPGFGEVFGKGSMVPTATEEKALFLYALSGEVARTLETVDGVVSARVHVVPGQPARFGQAPVSARASVLLKVAATRTDSMLAKRSGIQSTVAGSVDGLDADDVSVMITEVAPPPEVAPRVPGTEARYRAVLFAAAGTIGVMALALVATALRVRKLGTKDVQRPPAAAMPDTARSAS